jgi:hypothetical protein
VRALAWDPVRRRAAPSRGRAPAASWAQAPSWCGPFLPPPRERHCGWEPSRASRLRPHRARHLRDSGTLSSPHHVGCSSGAGGSLPRSRLAAPPVPVVDPPGSTGGSSPHIEYCSTCIEH